MRRKSSPGPPWQFVSACVLIVGGSWGVLVGEGGAAVFVAACLAGSARAGGVHADKPSQSATMRTAKCLSLMVSPFPVIFVRISRSCQCKRYTIWTTNGSQQKLRHRVPTSKGGIAVHIHRGPHASSSLPSPFMQIGSTRFTCLLFSMGSVGSVAILSAPFHKTTASDKMHPVRRSFDL